MTLSRILVTGGAGYIGSHTCKALADAGLTPITFDNFIHGHRRAVQWGPLVEGDLADARLLERVLREYEISAVVHFAGYCYVGESMNDPGKYFHNNTVNTLNLLEAMKCAGVGKIVFSSTCATYGIPQYVPMDEDHPQQPINPYGESKLFVERMLQWYGIAHGIKSVALRYFNAAGADPQGLTGEDHEPETHLIPLAIYAAMGIIPHLNVYGNDYPTPDGTAIRDYIHVTDLATAHERALRYLQDGGKSTVLNLGTGHGHSVREVIATVERISNRTVPVRDAARRPGDPPELVAAAAKAMQALNWQPQHSSLEMIVSTAWNWHMKHHSDSVESAQGALQA